jgi:hypothetical protein
MQKQILSKAVAKFHFQRKGAINDNSSAEVRGWAVIMKKMILQ